jgi:diacylglycerol kinase
LDRFKYAFEGLFLVFKRDKNVKFHFLIFLLTIFFSFFFNISKIEFIIVLICSGIVITLEIINSVIEKISDYVQKEFDLKIKEIKDMSASFVLVFSIFTFVIGLVIFLPKVIKYFVTIIE